MVDVVHRYGFECVSTGEGIGSTMTERRPLARFDGEREQREFASAFPSDDTATASAISAYGYIVDDTTSEFSEIEVKGAE